MPLGITASKNVFRVGEEGPPVLEATGSSGNVRWECNYGACVPDDEVVTTLAAENTSRYADAGDAVVVTVTDLDTEETAEVSVDVYATFTQQAGYGFEAEFDENTEISQAEDDSEVIFEGSRFAVYPLAFNNRDPEEYREAARFLARHGKRKLFYYDDRGLGRLLLGRRDSAVKQSPLTSGGISFSFAFRVNNWTPPAEEPTLAEELPLYGEAMPGV